MSIQIEKAGMLSTVQDQGRIGYAQYGVSRSGAMDPLAHKLANWLVGNEEQAATLEITWSGFAAVMLEDSWMAITGGNLEPMLDDQPLPMWRPVFITKGSRISFRKVIRGCRAYIGIKGGWAVKLMLHSASTYLRAGIGGLEGRALQAGDVLHRYGSALHATDTSSLLPDDPNATQANITMQSTDSVVLSRTTHSMLHSQPVSVRWMVSTHLVPVYDREVTIRILAGRQWDDFQESARQQFMEQTYQVTPQSDRMGYRLSGSELLLKQPGQYISEGVTHGTIQVPPDGQPIILMADRQTLGGYAKIAQVISMDLPLLAQLAPGASVRFRMIELGEAQRLYMEWQHELQLLHRMIHLRLGEIIMN